MILVAFIGVTLIGGVLYGVAWTGEMTRIGGTNWGLDYEWSRLEVNGVEAPAATRDSPGVWTYDPDGEPRGFPDWEGLSPGVGATVSLVGRCDANGNDAPSYDWVDPNQVSYNVSGKMRYLYYYKFTVTLKTIADQFFTYIHPWFPDENERSAEAGTVDIYATLTMILDRDTFTNESWDAWFMDAHIHDDELTETPEGLIFVLEPKIAKIQEVGGRVDFENTQILEDQTHYEGDLVFRARLTSGLTDASTLKADIFLPFEVFITRVIIVSLLMERPIEVGLGTEEEPDQPPKPVTQWWEYFLAWLSIYGIWLLIAIILIVACVVCGGRGGINIQKVGS